MVIMIVGNKNKIRIILSVTYFKRVKASRKDVHIKRIW